MYKLTNILSAKMLHMHSQGRSALHYGPFWLCVPCILNSLSLLSHHTYHSRYLYASTYSDKSN